MREHSLLVVDDEIFAVRGITEGICWREAGIQNVYGVCNVKEAISILLREHVDVVISDIEMPGKSGLDLLAWINENCPKTQVLLLTAYAKFDYAASALHYQAADYLLKPVVHEELKQRVEKCILEIEEEENREEELEKLRLAVPLLIEKFWVDIIERRNSAYPERIKELKKYVKIPTFPEDMVTPVLLIPKAETGMLQMEQDCREILLQIQMEQTGILREATGILWEEMIVLFFCGTYERAVIEEMKEELRKIEACQQFPFQICVGKATTLYELPVECETLLICGEQMGREQVLYPVEENQEGVPEKFPLVVDWIPMLERGKEDEFSEYIQELFEVLEQNRITGRKELREIYMGFWYSFAAASRRNSLADMMNAFSYQDRKVYRSLEDLKIWIQKIRSRYFEELKKNEKKNSAVMEKVEQYVMEHISEDFKREDIANTLYFNPSYLSHIFKVETGISLNKFINQLRIKEAKRLFDTTSLSVGTVAMDTGYYNFSYFSKQFKEMYHVTPSEYKKTVGNL